MRRPLQPPPVIAIVAVLLLPAFAIAAKAQELPEVAVKLGQSTIQSLAFTPDGGLAIALTGDPRITLWDMATGSVRRVLEGHTGRVIRLETAADADLMISSGRDDTVRVWSTSSFGLLQQLSIPGSWRAWISRNGATVVCITTRGASVWDVTNKRRVRNIIERGDPNDTFWAAVAVSPDGQQFAQASRDNVNLWDVKSGRLRARLEQGFYVHDLAFSPDGKYVIVVGAPIARQEQGRNPITGLPMTSVHLGGSETRVWGAGTHQLVYALKGQTTLVSGLAAMAVDGTLATAGDDKTVWVWDLRSGKFKTTFRGHPGEITALAVSDDGNLVASGDDDGQIKIWSVRTGALVATVMMLKARPDHSASEWIVWTADGYYNASDAAHTLIGAATVQGQKLTPSEYKTRFYRPELVERTLRAMTVFPPSR